MSCPCASHIVGTAWTVLLTGDEVEHPVEEGACIVQLCAVEHALEASGPVLLYGADPLECLPAR